MTAIEWKCYPLGLALVHGGRLSLLPHYPASPLCSQTKERGQAATAYLSLAGRWNGASPLPGPLGNDSASPMVESVLCATSFIPLAPISGKEDKSFDLLNDLPKSAHIRSEAKDLNLAT